MPAAHATGLLASGSTRFRIKSSERPRCGAKRFGKVVFGFDLCGATLRNRLSKLPRARLPTRSWLDGEAGADWLAYC